MGGTDVFEESQILDLLSTNVSERVSAKVHESLSSIIQDEIAKALTRALQEGHFYRALNSQVTDSIETVYSEIRAVKRLIWIPQDSLERPTASWTAL